MKSSTVKTLALSSIFKLPMLSIVALDAFKLIRRCLLACLLITLLILTDRPDLFW